MKKLLQYFLCSLMAFISVYAAAFLYPGNFWVYLIFSAICCGFLFYAVNFCSPFLIFIAILLWMGFWFKLNGSLYFNDGKLFEPVGKFDYSGDLYDRVLWVSSAGVMGFFSSALLFNKKIPRPSSELIVFSRRRHNLTWFLLIASISAVSFFNIEFEVFYRANKNVSNIPIFWTAVIQWLLFCGFTAISLILMYLTISLKGVTHVRYLLFVIFIDCVISTVTLSRVFVLSSFAILLLVFLNRDNLRLKFNCKEILIIGLVYLCLATANLVCTSYARGMLFSKDLDSSSGGNSLQQDNSVNKFEPSGGLKSLLMGRWIGIEGVAATQAYTSKGIDLIEKSWRDQRQHNQPSFYDRVIVATDTPYSNIKIKNYYAISLPGWVGYLNYSGSLLIVYFGSLFAGLFAQFVIKFSELLLSNPLLNGYIAYLIAYRYISFGYVPADSYKFLLAIGLLLVMAVIIKKSEFFMKFICVRAQVTDKSGG